MQKMSYCKAIWGHSGLKEQRNQHMKGMDFLFHWGKDQGLAETENKNECEWVFFLLILQTECLCFPHPPIYVEALTPSWYGIW